MLKPTKLLFVYTTWPNKENAENAAREIIQARLAACANCLPSMQSFYAWENKIESAIEAVVVFKTTADNAQALEKKILSLHPYKCPCIIHLDITGGHAAYLSWLQTSLEPVRK
jgi:periplasmic divalent cation tolerance protein